jgi:hypothetical protein
MRKEKSWKSGGTKSTTFRSVAPDPDDDQRDHDREADQDIEQDLHPAGGGFFSVRGFH